MAGNAGIISGVNNSPEAGGAGEVLRKKRSFLPLLLGGTAALILIVGMVLYFTVFSKEAVMRREVREQMDLAQRYLDGLDYEQAVLCYQTIVELDPRNVEALETLEDIYLAWAKSVAETDPEEAERIYAEAEEYFAEDVADGDIADAVSEIRVSIAQARDENIGEYISLHAEGAESGELSEEQGNGSSSTGGDSNKPEVTTGAAREERQDSGEDNDVGQQGEDSEEDGSTEEQEMSAEEEAHLQEEEAAELQAEAETQQTSVFDNAAVGSYVTFGHYEQDNNTDNGKEPIEWQVLAHSNGRTLLISRYALDFGLYNASYTDVTWETCSLRSWLNGTFIQNAFTVDEQAKIVSVTNDNPDSYAYFSTDYAIQSFAKMGYTPEEIQGLGAPGGNATQDKVFCLSWTEALNYFGSDSARECSPTAYAKAQGVWEGANGTCNWWMRSPGMFSSYAMVCNGAIGMIGVDGGFDAVRPALWVD